MYSVSAFFNFLLWRFEWAKRFSLLFLLFFHERVPTLQKIAFNFSGDQKSDMNFAICSLENTTKLTSVRFCRVDSKFFLNSCAFFTSISSAFSVSAARFLISDSLFAISCFSRSRSAKSYNFRFKTSISNRDFLKLTNKLSIWSSLKRSEAKVQNEILLRYISTLNFWR